MITFCLALKKRLSVIKQEDRQLPMSKPHYYVGYTSDGKLREKAHLEGSTTWLQHLIHTFYGEKKSHSSHDFASVRILYDK